MNYYKNYIDKMGKLLGNAIKTPNQLVMILLGSGQVAAIGLEICACLVMHRISMPIMIVAILFFLAGFLGLLWEYKRDSQSERFKYFAAVSFFIIYVFLLLFNKMDNIYVMGFVFGVFFILYFDLNIIILTQVVTAIPNFIQIAIAIATKKMPSGKPLDMESLFFQAVGVFSFGTLLAIVTAVSNEFNNKKNNEIKENGEKIENILSNVMEAAEQIKEDVDKGNEYMEALDTSTDNALQIFKDIAAGNIANAKSVEEQAYMTTKITELISKVKDNTNSAVDMTNASVKGMAKSKEILNILKVKSNELMEYNQHILNTINDFVVNTNKVKSITEGIIDISSQTNLLSLNASIESARAGEAGRGFAVVAEEIRKLADQTKELTASIAGIVASLEENAVEAKSVVEEVVKSINEESDVIDNTVNQFDSMEVDMNELDKDMKNVLNSTKQVVEYNEDIRKHVEQLSSYTEQLSASTEEALAINEDNKEKSKNTREIMKNLVERTDKLVKM